MGLLLVPVRKGASDYRVLHNGIAIGHIRAEEQAWVWTHTSGAAGRTDTFDAARHALRAELQRARSAA